MQHSAAQSYQQVLQVCTVKDCSVHLASAIKHRVHLLTIGFHILVDPKELIVLRINLKCILGVSLSQSGDFL